MDTNSTELVLIKPLERVANILGLSEEETANIIGCSVAQLETKILKNTIGFSPSSVRKSTYLIRLFVALSQLYGNDAQTMRNWLRFSHTHLHPTPLEFINSENALLEAVEYSERSLSR